MTTRTIVLGTIAIGLASLPATARAQQNDGAYEDTSAPRQQQQSHDQASDQAATTFDSLPQASKDTIDKYLKGGTVDHVDKTEQKGKTVYQAHCTLGNKAKDKIILLVDDAGKLVGSTPEKHREKK